MLTPAISSEIAKSSDVNSRAHPPFWMRLGEMLKEDQKKADIGGRRIHLRGELAQDRLVVRAVAAHASGLPTVFIRPSGGKSGLPNVGVGWFGTARAVFL